MRTRLVLSSLLALITCVGCGGDDGGPLPAEETPVASGTIGAGGGEVGDADVMLSVPAGALGDEAELAIYRDETGQPFADPDQPVYRLSGLPGELGAPATLRFRYEQTKAEAEPRLFLGEIRDSHHGGLHQSWEAVAARDSAGWMIADLPRGPLGLDGKSEPELSATVSEVLSALFLPGGHFEIVYDESEVSTAKALEILGLFNHDWQVLYDADFRFGDQDTIWPLSVYMREPVRETTSEYIIGPWGRGHFNFDPVMALEGAPLNTAVLHEIFHCAQDYYDTRHPSEWTTVNTARLWLDEATAAFMEGMASGDPSSYKPMGLNLDNYLAPLSGIWGHETFSHDKYGYGMSSFVRRLVALQGYTRVHDLYEAFSYHGTAHDAVMATADPPLSDWCVQFQRDLVTGDSTPIIGLDVVWWDWSGGEDWDWEDGAATQDLVVNDFGSNVWKCRLSGYDPPEDRALAVSVASVDRDGGPWELAIYGRSDGVEPVLLGIGVDAAGVDDLLGLHQTYEQLMIQVIKPRGSDPDYHHPETVRVTLDVAEDVSRYETANVSLRYHPVWNTGEADWQNLNINSAAGAWNGATFTAAWDTLSSGTRYTGGFTVTIDPADLSLRSWSAHNTRTTDAQNYQYYQTAGAGVVALSYTGSSYLRYNVDDAAVCDVTTEITQYTVSGGETTQELLSWSCDDNSYFEFYLRDLR